MAEAPRTERLVGDDRNSTAILVVEDNPADFIDALSGSTGITGVVDHIAMLRRGRGEADAVFHFTSRDAPEHETAVQLDGWMWSELGMAEQRV